MIFVWLEREACYGSLLQKPWISQHCKAVKGRANAAAEMERDSEGTEMNWTPIIGIALWSLIPGFIAKKKGRSFWAYYFLSFVITPLITIIITLCVKRKIEEDQDDVSDAAIAEQPMTALPQEAAEMVPRKIMYCQRCGSKRIEGSNFCSKCGNQFEKEIEI